jgi:hypothetical protein
MVSARPIFDVKSFTVERRGPKLKSFSRFALRGNTGALACGPDTGTETNRRSARAMNLSVAGAKLVLAVVGALVALIVLYKVAGWVFSGVLRLGCLLVGAGLAGAVYWGIKTGNQNLTIGASAALLFLTLVLLVFRRPKGK